MPRLASTVLRNDHWRVVVAPEYGGALLACEYDGEPVLAPVRQPLGHCRIACCYFPMVPFANRIENARFVFDERPVTLEANAAGVPHALHGHGWQRRWDLCQHDPARCTMTYRHEGAAGWPWRYRAWQTMDVRGARLTLRLRVRNDGDTTMPCGLGFHPFFPRAGAAARYACRSRAATRPPGSSSTRRGARTIFASSRSRTPSTHSISTIRLAPACGVSRPAARVRFA